MSWWRRMVSTHACGGLGPRDCVLRVLELLPLNEGVSPHKATDCAQFNGFELRFYAQGHERWQARSPDLMH